MSDPRLCAWCRKPLFAKARPYMRFCGRKCRQTAFRLRRRRATTEAIDRPLRFGYADPPFPGLARLYKDQPTFAGEVDHAALIASLEYSGYDGWALSTSARPGLRLVLPLCPPEARVCPWVKPHGAAPASYGLHNCWEPLIVVGGRQVQPGIRDWLSALPARGGGDLPGRKPLAFCAWLFDCLGMRPGDTIVDLFPGTGIVGKAWAELSSKYSEPSLVDGRRDSAAVDDVSLLEQRRGSSSPDDGAPEAVRARLRFLPSLPAPSDPSADGVDDVSRPGVDDT